MVARTDKEKLELELIFIYKNIIPKNITGRYFFGFLQAVYGMPKNINPVPLEHKIQGPFEKGYEEGRRLRKSYFKYEKGNVRFNFGRN